MISTLVLIVTILLSIALSTLIERKLLSLRQRRKGPETVGSLGLLQPFSDGLKLLSKKETRWANKFRLILAPLLLILSIFLFWLPLTQSILKINYGALYLLAVGSLGGLATLVVGWCGRSSYSFIGGLRASAQIISYEVVLSFFFILFCSIDWGLNTHFFYYFPCRLFFSIAVIYPLWILIILSETNRAPFDISEGESELVRGFNTEYSSVLFTMLFVGEYGLIIGYRVLTSYFFFGRTGRACLVAIVILWVRACFPRKRYDTLIYMLWVFFFPLILIFLGVGVFSLLT